MKGLLKSMLALVLLALVPVLAAVETAPEQAIFPGQAEPEISAGIIEAYNLALGRDYQGARVICERLGRDFPQSPAGPTGLMVLYQVMMLENEDYEYDREFRDAAAQAHERADAFAGTAPKNDWCYTLLGASYGIEGIYFLRRAEYMDGAMSGGRGLYYMQTAADRSPENWEAWMGIGVYIYYRSAFASIIPIPWLDQRERGIALVKQAGEKRPYLNEVSRIALFYINVNEKNYDRALAYMEELIRERPDFPIFYQFAGRAMLEKGDAAKAYGYYDKMHEIAPELYFPCLKLAECAMKLGRKEEARKWLGEFHRILGERPSVHRKEAERLLDELG